MYRVLIADDDLLMREALKKMISRIAGFEAVYSLGSCEEAIELCKEDPTDIIFMDIMMPGISGIEASKVIHSQNSSITIYIISGYSTFQFAKEALQSNVKEYISKPLTFEYLEGLLKNYKTEHEGCAHHQLDFLTEMLKEQNFGKVYYGIPNVINEIYSNNHRNREELMGILNYIGQSLVSLIMFPDHGNKNIQELYPLNAGLIYEKKISELWLFKVVNYVFQEKSIQRYPLLENVFLYIEEHIRENIGLNQIIEYCSMSQGYLSRIFKKQFQVSVMEYLHMRKINLAKGYFCFTDDSIADVAFRLGYNESSYFSKVFKKYEFMTVHQYKKMMQEESGVKS